MGVFNVGLLTRRGQIFQRIDGPAVIADLKMEHGIAAGLTAHIGDMLADRHRIAFLDEQGAIISVCTQIVIVVLENNELAVAQEPAPRIHDTAARRRPYRLPRSSTDINALTNEIGFGEGLDYPTLNRPLPFYRCSGESRRRRTD